MPTKKPKQADTDYRRWTYKHFEDKYNQILEDIEREEAGNVSDNKNPIVYITLGNVLTRLLGKFSNSWRRDILNDEDCISAKEKYALLEGHDQRQQQKLLTYALNDRQHQFAATKVLEMVMKPRMGAVDMSLNNKQEAADHLSFTVEASGRLNTKGDKD